jgi:hypothetical protein
MNCTVCGSDNAPGTRFCGNCGRPLGEQPGTPAPGQGAPVPPADQPTAPSDYPQQPQQPVPQQPPSGDYPPPGYVAPDQYPQQPEPTAPAGYDPYQQPATSGDYPAPGGEYPPPGYVPPDQYQQPAPGYAAPGAPGGPGGPGYPPGPSGQMYAGYPPAQPPQQQKGKRRGLLIVLALLVVAGLGAGAFIVLTGDDDTGGGLGSQVVLEPVSSVRPGGFTDDDSLDLEQIGASVADALAGVPTFGDDLVASLAGRSTAGTEPGLYGGSQDVETCDVEGLVTFLTADENAAKAEAWAGTLNIEVSEIPDYVAGLTAVRLRFDTRVTNHGFRDGEANAFQSVLQAGTAVLVDDQGIPRVKCNCGNPLLEPEPVGGDLSESEQTQALDIQEMAENPQDAWEGLDPTQVVSVTPGDAVTVFILVSPEGRLFKRPVGSAGAEDARVEDVDEIGNLCETFGESPTCVETSLGSGDVQATLRWSSSADLDLHVVEPDGTEIYYLAPGPTSTGGELDVDSNVNCVAESGVENVFWPPAEAPTGDYVVSVHGFSVDGANCGGGDYELTIKISGQDDQVFTGSVAADETDEYPVTFDG